MRVDIVGRLISGTMEGDDPENSLSAGLDLESVEKLIKAIEKEGVPDLQVVYFPGSDIFTHGSACETDSHIPFILTQQGGWGAKLRPLVQKMGGDAPSAMAVTPLVRALFGN